MAAVLLSPSAIPISVMSTRRTPLSSNPNAANSPLRGTAAALAAKQRRSHADVQREEAYGQPPPAKRQMLDLAGSRVTRSPISHKIASVRSTSQRTTVRGNAGEKASTKSTASRILSEEEVESLRQWQTQLRARLPKMVFYFESLPDDQRNRLTKQVTHLGAREEKFFSINITHVVTTRPIPSLQEIQKQEEAEANTEDQTTTEQHPRTIDPSLLNRSTDLSTVSASVKRKLLFDTSSNRRLPLQVHDDTTKRAKGRNTDILHRAREMGKKIWSLEKLQKIVEMLLEPDLDKVAVLAYGARGTGDLQESTSSKSAAEGTRLLQLLQHERVHGPSDRDHTVASNELIYFKGPYIYVYDIEEKQKPIMVREYAKVADKKDGDWPQFRTAGNGRCPFVEDGEVGVEKKQKREPERVSKASVPPAATLKPPPQQSTRSITGKRTLMEMEDGSNRGAAATTGRTRTTDTSKISNPPSLDFQPQQNAFTSRAREARLFAGEPVASGVQPSNITSAVKSAMISSTTGGLAPKAGTSKEMYRLQRKVLQRNSVPLTSGTSSSRRVPIGESGQHDTASFMRSNSMGRPTSTKLQAVEEEERRPTEKLRRTASVPVSANQTKPKKKELKPGYCENCQDKFEDFDQHILSNKHRKFASNDRNFCELDDLLSKLIRPSKYASDNEDV